MKAILILDMPDRCGDCMLCDGEHFTCNYYNTMCADSGRRRDCPLQSMPEKRESHGYLDVGNEDGLYEQGWNACIGKIMDNDTEVGYQCGWNTCLEELENE